MCIFLIFQQKKESLMQASSLFLTGDMLTLSVVYMHFTVMIILHERFMVDHFVPWSDRSTVLM